MNRKVLAIVFAQFTLLVVGLGLSEAKDSSDTLTAAEILNRMSQTYTTSKTYKDSGVVRTKFIQNGSERIVEKPFTTAFIRPYQFRYEYREKKDYSNNEERYIIWSEGKEVLVWWDLNPKIEKAQSLGMALAGATGVSGGSAHTIPALLLPEEVGGRMLTDIREAKRISDEVLGSVICFRIEGRYGSDSAVIWIDSKSFLVRLITTQHNFPYFSTETRTSYNPEVNTEIAAKVLEFDPPKQKQ